MCCRSLWKLIDWWLKWGFLLISIKDSSKIFRSLLEDISKPTPRHFEASSKCWGLIQDMSKPWGLLQDILKPRGLLQNISHFAPATMNSCIARFPLPLNQLVLSKIESTFSSCMHWVSGLGPRGIEFWPKPSRSSWTWPNLSDLREATDKFVQICFFLSSISHFARLLTEKRELSYINFGCTPAAPLLVVIWKYQTWNFESLFNHGHCTKTRNICSILFSWFFSASNVSDQHWLGLRLPGNLLLV